MTVHTQTPADIASFLVGYGPMDAIHREFHDLVGALLDAGDAGEKLLALHEHLLRHCAQEEHWMRVTNFAACACHVREHEMLLEVVAEVRRRFDAGDSDVVLRLAHELPQWFAVHASSMDVALAEHLREYDASMAMLPVHAARRASGVAPFA